MKYLVRTSPHFDFIPGCDGEGADQKTGEMFGCFLDVVRVFFGLRFGVVDVLSRSGGCRRYSLSFRIFLETLFVVQIVDICLSLDYLNNVGCVFLFWGG